MNGDEADPNDPRFQPGGEWELEDEDFVEEWEDVDYYFKDYENFLEDVKNDK